jgi:hypothetical protein
VREAPIGMLQGRQIQSDNPPVTISSKPKSKKKRKILLPSWFDSSLSPFSCVMIITIIFKKSRLQERNMYCGEELLVQNPYNNNYFVIK